MGILREVSKICAMIKKSQAPGFYYIPQGAAGDSLNASNAHLLRGAAKGLNNAIPAAVDSTVGLVSGIVGGVSSSLAGDGFGYGYDKGTALVHDNISEPLRSAGANSPIGKFVNKNLTNTIKFHENIAGGHDPANDIVEDVSELVANNALSWPMAWKMFGWAGKGLQAGGKAVAASRLASAAPRTAKAIETSTRVAGKALPAAAVMTPPLARSGSELVDAWDNYKNSSKGGDSTGEEGSGVSWGDFVPVALGGLGTFLLAKSLLGGGGNKSGNRDNERPREESMWSKITNALVPIGSGVVGAYGAKRLMEILRQKGITWDSILNA